MIVETLIEKDKDGVISRENHERFVREYKALPPGLYIERILPFSDRRSDQQNDYLHVIYRLMVARDNETNGNDYTELEMKNASKKAMGYYSQKAIKNSEGMIIDVITTYEKTSEMNKREFRLFLRKLHWFCIEYLGGWQPPKPLFKWE